MLTRPKTLNIQYNTEPLWTSVKVDGRHNNLAIVCKFLRKS